MASIRTSIHSAFSFAVTSAKIFRRTKSIRQVINLQFSDENKVVVELGELDHVVTKDGNKFYMSRLINTVTQVRRDYVFDDIRNDDSVIDIGAGIGAFAIPASRKARHVYALEPITADMLKDNILLNKRQNIHVLDVALGDGSPRTIEWFGKSRTMRTHTLSEIRSLCGGCDFLKMDCEGCEWHISPGELLGIRRVEMEVHELGFPLSRMEHTLVAAGFKYEITAQPEGNIGLWVIHAVRQDAQ